MSTPDEDSLLGVDDETSDRPRCRSCLDRPVYWLGRYRHRLWICLCGQAWHTKRGHWEKATWTWKRWPR
jgi:hypothetical protein